jgi:hypothetical protein
MMMNKPTINEILAPRPEARLRIYAYPNDYAARIALLASVLEVESTQGELP